MAAGGAGFYHSNYFHDNYWHTEYWAEEVEAPAVTTGGHFLPEYLPAPEKKKKTRKIRRIIRRLKTTPAEVTKRDRRDLRAIFQKQEERRLFIEELNTQVELVEDKLAIVEKVLETQRIKQFQDEVKALQFELVRQKREREQRVLDDFLHAIEELRLEEARQEALFQENLKLLLLLI